MSRCVRCCVGTKVIVIIKFKIQETSLHAKCLQGVSERTPLCAVARCPHLCASVVFARRLEFDWRGGRTWSKAIVWGAGGVFSPRVLRLHKRTPDIVFRGRFEGSAQKVDFTRVRISLFRKRLLYNYTNQ